MRQKAEVKCPGGQSKKDDSKIKEEIKNKEYQLRIYRCSRKIKQKKKMMEKAIRETIKSHSCTMYLSLKGNLQLDPFMSATIHPFTLWIYFSVCIWRTVLNGEEIQKRKVVA